MVVARVGVLVLALLFILAWATLFTVFIPAIFVPLVVLLLPFIKPLLSTLSAALFQLQVLHLFAQLILQH